MERRVYTFMASSIKAFLNKKTGKILSYIIFASFIFLISYVTIQNKYDDFIFMKAIEDYGSFGNWLRYFAENWSGRLIPQGLQVIILQCPNIVFHIINTAMWMVLLYYVAKDFDYYRMFDRRTVMFVVFASIYLFMPSGVIDGALSWKSANPLYLWGGAAMLVGIYPFICRFHGDSANNKDIILALLSIIYVSGFEQGAVLMCGIMLVMILFFTLRDKKPDSLCLFLFIFSGILTVFFFLMPGNDARYLCEVLDNYEKYDMFSMMERLLIGINYAIAKAEKNIPHLLSAISLIVMLVRLLNKEKDMKSMIMAILPLIYFTYCLTINSETMFSFIYKLVDVENKGFDIKLIYLMLELINVGMIVLLGMNLSYINRDEFNSLLFSLFFGGFGSMAVMGFSPSIHMSGQRPRFLGYLCFMCCILIGIIEIKKILRKNKIGN